MTDLPPSDLDKTLENLKKSIDEREKNRQYQLAFWADPQRGIPNEFTRSALFAAVPLNKAAYVEDETIFSQKGFTITYTGKQLTQSDLDVFEGVMHLARGFQENEQLRFRAGHLLKHIGRQGGKSQKPGKSDYEWLLKVLKRLTATAIGIQRDGTSVYWGSLLPEGAAKLDNGEFVIHINRQLIKLFDRGFTTIEWEQRRALAKKPLAQHLHAWICSHTKPFPVSVEYLRDLTGSNTKDLKHFRANLKNALEEILEETGAITAYHIDEEDKVHITKAPYDSSSAKK